MKLQVCTTKDFLQKPSQKLSCMLVVFIGQMLTFDGHWHAGEVFTEESRFQLYRADSVVWASGLLMSTL
jgi:hypothetical protein